MRTVYVFRIRADESEPWGEPEYYRTRKERNDMERMNRCLGGIRTHSYEEKKTAEEVEQLFGRTKDRPTVTLIRGKEDKLWDAIFT